MREHWNRRASPTLRGDPYASYAPQKEASMNYYLPRVQYKSPAGDAIPDSSSGDGGSSDVRRRLGEVPLPSTEVPVAPELSECFGPTIATGVGLSAMIFIPC